MIRRHIPSDRFVQDPVDLRVPLRTAPIPVVGDGVTLVAARSRVSAVVSRSPAV
jgi:hypothetical protein